MSEVNSSVKRMRYPEVLGLHYYIDSNIDLHLNSFAKANPNCSIAIKYLSDILKMIDDPDKYLNQRINVEASFGYSKGIFDLLCEKVNELILMMNNADNDKYSPLSFGSIKNVGMSLFRRIFFVANEKEIRTISEGEIVYPYLVVDDELNYIMFNMFLCIYFSSIREFLIPLYVYAAIEFCKKKHVVKFNVSYPINGNLALHQYKLYNNVFNLARNNPPGSIPYAPSEQVNAPTVNPVVIDQA